mgnify:CR=1 FL=1
MKCSGLRAFILAVAALTVSATPTGAQSGVREVSATERGVILLQTRLRYTTMVVLPDGEEILDVLCGDRDFWVISATHNIAHVKPAKAGAETNLNLVTSSGTIYSFMLSEKSSPPDLKVYVQGEPGGTSGKQKYYSATQVEALESQRNFVRLLATRGGSWTKPSQPIDSSIPRDFSFLTACPSTRSPSSFGRCGMTGSSHM